MPAGPRKPVERHNGRVYWPTRDVAVGFVDFFHAPGRILGTQTFRAAGVFPHFTYTHFSGCRHRRSLATQTFRVAVAVAFYLHKLFGLPSPSHLHFSYTNVSGGRGFSFYLHTRF